uniref:Uncharacterized protein n=1 Tax=Wallerfield virus TaxID=1457165 RepID=A0A1U7EJD4_9VIRU|nr:hypothetical protein 2 [Wallerfield virus]
MRDIYCFLLFALTMVTGKESRDYFLASMGRNLKYFTELDNIITHKLLSFDFEYNIYGKYVEDDIKVYHANAWSKFIGSHCPPNHHKVSLQHHIFSELYVCIHVPTILKNPHSVYKINQNYNEVLFSCYIPGGDEFAIETIRVNIPDLDKFRIIEFNGKNFLTSQYCISDRYGLTSDHKEVLHVNYTVTDNTISFQFPKGECRKNSELIWDIDSLHPGYYLPFVIKITASKNMHKCLTYYYTPYDTELDTNVTVLPLTPTEHLIWAVDVSPTIVDARNLTRVWSSINYYPPPSDTVIHIGSAITNSPFNFISSAILAILRPIIDILLDSLIYILTTLMEIFESSEFLDIVNRLFDLVYLLIKNIFEFIVKIIYPRLLDIVLSFSTKYKFLFVIFIITYIKTGKFFVTCIITFFVNMCMREREV